MVVQDHVKYLVKDMLSNNSSSRLSSHKEFLDIIARFTGVKCSETTMQFIKSVTSSSIFKYALLSYIDNNNNIMSGIIDGSINIVSGIRKFFSRFLYAIYRFLWRFWRRVTERFRKKTPLMIKEYDDTIDINSPDLHNMQSVSEYKDDQSSKKCVMKNSLIYYVNKQDKNDVLMMYNGDIELRPDSKFILDKWLYITYTIKIIEPTSIISGSTIETLTFYCEKKNIQKLINFLNDIRDEYKLYQQVGSGGIQIVRYPDMTFLPFNAKKTFDHIWFDKKHDFLNYYRNFMENENEYINRADPYTFSILLHGLPGCGKTSLIKSIANDLDQNYSRRYVITLNMNQIARNNGIMKNLSNIFLNDRDGIYPNLGINYTNSIIVIEDFDLCDFAHIFRHREEQEEIVNNLIKSKKIDSRKLESYPSLDDFLNILDGIVERHGAMVIWTTNADIGTFDKAFIRPGRIDMAIEFKRTPVEGIIYLVDLFYGNNYLARNSSPGSYMYSKLKMLDRKYTPSEIKYHCKVSENPTACIDHMINELPAEIEAVDDEAVDEAYTPNADGDFSVDTTFERLGCNED